VVAVRTIAIVSHTLEHGMRRRLRVISFRERVSESSIIEAALRLLFRLGSDKEIGDRLRRDGASLRRSPKKKAHKRGDNASLS
jgi:hypothetical protein